MQIDWWTLALQAVNFLVLVWLLWRFLYRPVKEVLEKRRALAEQAFADADRQKAEAEAARQRLEADRAALARERQDLLKRIHEELEAERRQVLDEARAKADELVEGARESLARERETVLAEVRDEVAELAVELASDLLRKAEANASSGVFLERLERRLQNLPEEERQRLRKDLAEDGARLVVATALPLTPEDRGRWADRLSAGLGQAVKTDFVADPAILGGAELRFPHAVLRFSWADQLRKTEELLRRDEAAS